MSNIKSQPTASPSVGGIKIIRAPRVKTKKVLPTDRVNVAKQLDILRAYVAVSGQEKKPVSNEEVSKVANFHFGTISNCNPFFLDVGLLSRQKNGNIPSDDVFIYADRFKWDGEKAAVKLAPTVRKSWFCSVLLPKLSFRSLTVAEAINFLADEAGAPPEFKDQLMMLLSYMKVTGIISIEGANVSLIDVVATEEKVDEKPLGASNQGDNTSVDKSVENDNSKNNVCNTDVSNHPFIAGLLKKLPEPETEWSISGRVKWLQTAAHIFDLMYTAKESDPVEVIEIKKTTL